MGKKKDKKSSWDGKSNSYDYIRDKFDSNYRPLRGDRESSGVYNEKRNRDFDRYMMTGEMDNGIHISKNKKDNSMEGKLFKAGIPPSQWQYYANKAGITNMNSKDDAKALINYYNKDERYQGDNDKQSGNKDDKDPAPLVPFAKGPVKPSAHLQAVNDRLSAGVPKLYDEQANYMSPAPKDDDDQAARLFKEQYAVDVTAGLNIREDRKLNLTNAMYSA